MTDEKETSGPGGSKLKLHEASEEQEVQHAEQRLIKVFVGQLGKAAKELEVPEGTTLGEVIEAESLQKKEIRLNRTKQGNETQLKQGDLIIAVPDALRHNARLAA